MPLQPTLETIKALQAIAEDLFEKTRADRTTIRVETPNDPDYPVLAEARAAGVSSLTGGMCMTSQMLTPLEHEGRFVGILSVHAIEPRDWSEAGVATMEETTKRVQRELDRGTWVSLST